MRDLVIVMLVSFLLLVGGIWGQENPSVDLSEKLQTLQGQFDQWQQTLVGMHFEESTTDQHWLTLLNQQRSRCLETMKAANGKISAVELEKGEGPRLAQEFVLVDYLSRLTDQLDNLLNLVQSSFGVSPPASKANPPPSFKWTGDLISMLKAIQPVWGILRSDVYNALEARGQSRPAGVEIPPSAPIQLGAPGEISGHVYRADTGTPLANAIVTLSSSPSGNAQSKRTATDGSYQFTALAPGFYWVSAYRTGFVGQVSGKNEPQTVGLCPPSCVSLSGGQKLDGIDLRLSADPGITQMSEDGFSSAYPEKPLRLQFGPGRFSPDGKFFAIAVASQAGGGLWLYDMHSHGLTLVTDGRAGTSLEFGIRDWDWTGDNTLYLSGVLTRHRVGHQAYAAVTMTGVAEELTEIPPQIAASFKEDEALEPPAGSGMSAHNDQYFLTSGRLCHGCRDTLSARPRSGGATRLIAEIDRNFTFDPERSLVFYPKMSFYGTGSIVIFDLKSWRPQEIGLPVAAEFLLDQTRDAAGHLVAYVVQGSCEPDASSEEALSQLLVPGNSKLRREQPRSSHVCFVKLP